MAVPYRRTPKAVATGLAAFVDVLMVESDRSLYGGLLIIDALGQPQEFAHNCAVAPVGIAWGPRVDFRIGVPQLVHSLFDVCRREPDLIVIATSIGSAEFVNAEIAPALPCAQVTPPAGGLPAEWAWINSPPTESMRAAFVAAELERRGLFIEPFDRLAEALKVVYPQADWAGVRDEHDI